MFLFISSTTAVFAHGTAVSIPKDDGNYTIEFEYQEQEVVANETNAFTFIILNKGTETPVPFDSVLVRFERKSDQATYIAAKVTQDELQEGVGRLSTMLNEGAYTVSSAFYKNENKIAEANFDLNVLADTTSKAFPTIPFVAGVGGLIVGFGIGKIYTSAKKDK